MIVKRKILTLLALLAGCSSKSTDKPKDKATPATSPATKSSTAPAPSTQMLPDGPRTIERTKLASIKRKGLDGPTRDWMALEASQVTGIDYKELYQSRGESFVSFKGTIGGGDENCLVHWKAELIQSKTGRGPSLRSMEGTVPVPAGTPIVASGIVNLAPAIAGQVGSASVGYWSLCGDALHSPSAFDIPITETQPEQIKYGKSFDLHHTRLAMESRPLPSKAAARCYFELVVEDVDKDGFTLNRDFASFSLVPGSKSSAKLRRTTFEGGVESDYVDLAIGKRSYVRNLVCKDRSHNKEPTIEGLRIRDLALRPYEGEPTTAEQHVRTTFGQSATLQNITGKDCSFRLRYRVLDTNGLPINRSPILSEAVHLKKGATVNYQSPSYRLFVWNAQASDVGSLVIEHAAPIQNCTAFDASKAL